MNRAVRIEPPAPDPAASSHLASWYMPGLSDGLGDRLLMFDNTTSASLELLRFRRELTDWPAFDTAVRTRMRELEHFQHAGVARVRAFRSLGEGEGLALVSNHTVGQRLSEMLHAARGPALGFDLIRQLTPILADLQGQGEDIAHGLLTPERIIVTPGGKLVMVEHVLGAALQAVDLPAHRLRADLGLAVRGHDGALGRRGDVIQLGLAALSLVLGRRIEPGDYPLKVASLLDELELIDAPGASDFARLRRWMQHALQLGGRTFGSAAEAHEALLEAIEQRDDTPRENVIAFPGAVASAVSADPAIEIVSGEPGLGAARTTARAAAMPVEEFDYDVGAMWRAAQAHASRGPAYASGTGSAFPAPDDALTDAPPRAGRSVRLSLDVPRNRVTMAMAWLLAWVRAAPAVETPQDDDLALAEGWVERRSSPYTAPLAVLCVVQAVLLALLLAVPPAPEPIVMAGLEVPAPPGAAADIGGTAQAQEAAQAATAQPAGGLAPVTPTAAPPRPPRTFTENFVDGLREAPAAFGRGVAAVWRAGADLVSGLFSRAPESAAR
jgi:hypothetical protein